MTDVSSAKKLVFIHQLTPMQMKIQDSSVFGGLSQIGAGIGAQSYAKRILRHCICAPCSHKSLNPTLFGAYPHIVMDAFPSILLLAYSITSFQKLEIYEVS